MIDFKKSIKEWTTEDLKMQLYNLQCKMPFMFMPPDISKSEVKECNDIMNDIIKIENELKKRGEK